MNQADREFLREYAPEYFPGDAGWSAIANAVESAMLEHEQLPILTEDHAARGLAGRSVLIPAGVRLVGAEHLGFCMNVVVGDITVWTANGERRITGIEVFESGPGTKRIGLAHKDTFWLCVHSNPKNLRGDALLEMLIADPSALLSNRDRIEA